MKYLKTFTVLLILFVVSCKKDNDPVSEADRIRQLLTTGAWNVTQVMVDGMPTDVYDGLTIRFTATTIIAGNGEPLWPASVGWSFVDETAKAIQRSDGISIDIVSISENGLTIELVWDNTTLAGGKRGSIAGEHRFDFVH